MTAMFSMGTLGRWAPKEPSCWGFFGFDGPTNEHNLRLRYADRINGVVGDNAQYTAHIADQYQRCLADLRSST